MFTVYLTCLQVLTILSRYYVNIALPFGGVPINKRAHTVTHSDGLVLTVIMQFTVINVLHSDLEASIYI